VRLSFISRGRLKLRKSPTKHISQNLSLTSLRLKCFKNAFSSMVLQTISLRLLSAVPSTSLYLLVMNLCKYLAEISPVSQISDQRFPSDISRSGALTINYLSLSRFFTRIQIQLASPRRLYSNRLQYPSPTKLCSTTSRAVPRHSTGHLTLQPQIRAQKKLSDEISNDTSTFCSYGRKILGYPG
jgi:hypothetical protein